MRQEDCPGSSGWAQGDHWAPCGVQEKSNEKSDETEGNGEEKVLCCELKVEDGPQPGVRSSLLKLGKARTGLPLTVSTGSDLPPYPEGPRTVLDT